MAAYGFIKIYSNDGQTVLGSWQVSASAPTITVKNTGVSEGSNVRYTYTGDKKFLGFAEVANSTEPIYSVGNTYTLSTIASMDEKYLYIVEGEADKDYLIKGSTLTSMADAIRAKTGKTEAIAVENMATEIGDISTDSALPIEVTTEAEMTALLTNATDESVGEVYKYTGETTDNYESGSLYILQAEEVEALAGTWVFNDGYIPGSSGTWSVNFSSNGNSYSTLSNKDADAFVGYELGKISYDGVFVYVWNDDTMSYYWKDSAYKTINITSKLSEVENGDTLLAWLQANATKQ